jgi:hypothetical protein
MYRNVLFPVDLEHADDWRNALPVEIPADLIVMATHRPRVVRVSRRPRCSVWLMR